MAAKKAAKKKRADRDGAPATEREPKTVEGTTREHRAVDARGLREEVKGKAKR